MNKIIVHGRLIKDPEVKNYGEGKHLTTFAVACDKDFGEGADLFSCTAFGKTGEIIAKHFHKGKEILVIGSMNSNKKDDKTYWSVNVNSFDFCGGKSESKPAKDDTPEGFETITEGDMPF